MYITKTYNKDNANLFYITVYKYYKPAASSFIFNTSDRTPIGEVIMKSPVPPCPGFFIM